MQHLLYRLPKIHAHHPANGLRPYVPQAAEMRSCLPEKFPKLCQKAKSFQLNRPPRLYAKF